MQHKSGSLPPTTAGGGTAPVARAGQWSVESTKISGGMVVSCSTAHTVPLTSTTLGSSSH